MLGVVGLVLGVLAYDKRIKKQKVDYIYLKPEANNRTTASDSFTQGKTTIKFDGNVQFQDTSEEKALAHIHTGSYISTIDVYIEGIYPSDLKLGFTISVPDYPYYNIGTKKGIIYVYEYTEASDTSTCGQDFIQVGGTTYLKGNKVGYYSPIITRTGLNCPFTAFGQCLLSSASRYGVDNNVISLEYYNN